MIKAQKRSLSLISLGQGIIELFFYLPVALTIAAYLLPSDAVWLWIAILPFCYWAGSLWVQKYTNKRYGIRLLAVTVIGILHIGLLTIASATEISMVASILCSAVAAILALRGISGQLLGWTISYSNTQILIGVFCYIAVQPLKLMMLKELIAYNSVLMFCGVAAVVCFVFILNERHLNNETIDTGKSTTMLAVKRQNRLLMLIIVGSIAIIALFRQIQQMIENFFRMIIERFFNGLQQPREETTPEAPANPAPEMPSTETKPPSDFMLLLEQIFKIIGALLIIVVVCLVIYLVVRKLSQWVKMIAAKLRERELGHRNHTAGYTDEVESLMTLTNLREQMGKKLKSLLPKRRSFAEEWQELATNAAKIKYLYARLLRIHVEQGYKLKRHLTPRETTNDMAKWNKKNMMQEELLPFIEVYEEVRYGDKLPNDHQVDDFKRQFYKKGNQA